MKKIGAYEAKTTLPALLQAVERGERVTITRSGRPVADLVPHHGEVANPKRIAARMRHMRRGITLGDHSIEERTEEGHR